MPCNKVLKQTDRKIILFFKKAVPLPHCVALGKSWDFFASQTLQQFNWMKAEWMARCSNIQYAADAAAERSILG